ncbi:hypothetical protein DRW42_26155 [Pedobacter miscanthi]|uniref:Uncharacterized protein n=1 Tax=Pedobacter miscanthi TaxID=2259170 RepID=A0A366KMK2_9SPHI|nr:hypothetical protein DRW42_26155 [Pedobacter miscanthi]
MVWRKYQWQNTFGGENNLSKDANGFTDIHYQKQSAPNGEKAEEMDVRKRIRYILSQNFSQFPD